MTFTYDEETLKHLMDAFSIATIVGALVNVLPAIAALLSIVWTLFRIYETKTVQSWLRRWRMWNANRKDKANG